MKTALLCAFLVLSPALGAALPISPDLNAGPSPITMTLPEVYCWGDRENGLTPYVYTQEVVYFTGLGQGSALTFLLLPSLVSDEGVISKPARGERKGNFRAFVEKEQLSGDRIVLSGIETVFNSPGSYSFEISKDLDSATIRVETFHPRGASTSRLPEGVYEFDLVCRVGTPLPYGP